MVPASTTLTGSYDSQHAPDGKAGPVPVIDLLI